jgi:hypothetical protein
MRLFVLLPLGLLVSLVVVHAGTRAERLDTGRDTATDTGLDTAADAAVGLDDDTCAMTLGTDETTGETLLSFHCGALASATLDMLLELAPEDHLCAVDATTDALVCGVVASAVSGVVSPLCDVRDDPGQTVCRMPLYYSRPPAPGPTCASIAASYGVNLNGTYSNTAVTPLPIGSTMCVPSPTCTDDPCTGRGDPCRCAPASWSGGGTTGGGPAIPGHTPGVGLMNDRPPGAYSIRPSALPN